MFSYKDESRINRPSWGSTMSLKASQHGNAESSREYLLSDALSDSDSNSPEKFARYQLNQAVIQDGRVDIQSKNDGYVGNDNRNARRQNKNQATNAGSGQVQQIDETNKIFSVFLHEAKYFKEQMMMAMKDEAGGNLNDEENDFMLTNNAYGDDTLEELTAAVIMMVRIQPEDYKVETEPKKDAKAIS
ncbi:hypothetical protein Tco_0962205 [Tanacetum coccineum]